MRHEFFRLGWQQPVGWLTTPVAEPTLVEDSVCAYLRVELRDVYLSHAASLFFLQGASIRQVFSDVVLRIGDRAPEFYSVIFAAPPRLYRPPPKIDYLVLAHLLERPADISPDELFQKLFMGAMAHASQH